MLRELHIKNFSIIDDATIEFGGGFNVLTGETGAGKSIIINALSLALGERAAGDLVRSGEKEAVVEAFFDIPPPLLNHSTRQLLEDSGIDFGDGLILKRIVSIQGRSRAYINGSLVSVQTLSDISRDIIDVHGQYEHQSLLSANKQMDFLDAYGGLVADREEVSGIYKSKLDLKRQINELVQKEKERAQRLDMLRFQIREIEAADLKHEEKEDLGEELKILSSAARLAELANRAYDFLYSSDSACITSLSKVLDDLKEISCIDTRASDAAKSAEEALLLLEETGYFLRDYKEGVDFNPQRLEQVQERLDIIKGLTKKYGEDIREVLDYKEKALSELEELQRAEEKLDDLKTQLKGLKNTLTEKARMLSNKRKTAAKKIEADVKTQLSELSMPGARFSVLITQEKGDDTENGFKAKHTGIDTVEFLISLNIGEDLKPLSKTASGGELSRIMLALKGIMAKGDKIPVLIFDEIDTGVGGRTAETVGRKLKYLSSEHQVICITHLPQIASYAEGHLKIEKKIKKDKTTVKISKVDRDERTREVARMLSGKISEVSIRHAKEMLKQHSGKNI